MVYFVVYSNIQATDVVSFNRYMFICRFYLIVVENQKYLKNTIWSKMLFLFSGLIHTTQVHIDGSITLDEL